jgi:rubrerythrin
MTTDDIEWNPPQQPKRRCHHCGTILRQSNPDNHCELCKRKLEQKKLTDRDLW